MGSANAFSRSLKMILLTLVVCCGTVIDGGAGAVSRQDTIDPVAIVRTLLATPESKIDFARAKLTIDKLVDPQVDVASGLAQIDRMAEIVSKMAGTNAGPIQKLGAVRRFIYVDGEWNGHRPFQYDLNDPLGQRLANKLLPIYIATRRGNCVSMPILFVIVADRLGVHATISTAPLHVFAKYVDDRRGKVYNLETTSGGYPERDAWLRQNFPMTDEAVKNGVYLKTLSRREAVAVMAELLLEHDMQERHYRAVIDMAELILEFYQNDVNAMLAEGTAYAHLIDVEFRQRYPDPQNIPRKLKPVYQTYARKNEELFDRALALGWHDTEKN